MREWEGCVWGRQDQCVCQDISGQHAPEALLEDIRGALWGVYLVVYSKTHRVLLYEVDNCGLKGKGATYM